MGQTLASPTASIDETEAATTLQELLAEMQRCDERIRRHQASIDRIGAETRAILDDIKRIRAHVSAGH